MKDTPVIKYSIFCLYLVWISTSQSLPTKLIQTSSGPIEGFLVKINGDEVYQFLGIPYAEPPLRDLRFRKPQPVQPWSETFKANKMPPACIQYSVYPFPWYDFKEGKSEDCLHLNIWVPKTKGSNDIKKCVMFWIHGGGFAYGSIRMPVYNGRPLAAEGDVIVVTTNYRLAAFGFFTTNSDDNVALYDMLEALKWVNKNIDAFGGDPQRVTIFGESAGSIAAGLFCVSPLTKDLFSRVIMESGSPIIVPYFSKETNFATSLKLAVDLGCADPTTNISVSPDKVDDCMRKKDAYEIAITLNSYNPNTGAVFFPVYGDEFLPDSTQLALKTGKFHNVSLLIGNNLDEGSVLLTMYNPEILGFFGKKLPDLNNSVVQNLVKNAVQDTFKDLPNTALITQSILASLNEDDYRKNLKYVYDFFGDFVLACPDVYFAESYSYYGNDAYFYVFEHRPSNTPWAEWMGVVHYEEIKFVFGSPLIDSNYTEEERELGKFMMKMWSNFAKYGYPLQDELEEDDQLTGGESLNDSTLDKWPTYSREKPLYLIIDESSRKSRRYDIGPQKANCDLYRAVYGYL